MSDGYNWTAQLPLPATTVPTNVYVALDALVKVAYAGQDEQLFRAVAAAWSLAGYNPQWLENPKRRNDFAFCERAVRRRSREKMRAEGWGILRALEALDRFEDVKLDRLMSAAAVMTA